MPRKVTIRLDELRAMEYRLAKLLETLERREHKFRNLNGYPGAVLHLSDLRKDFAERIQLREKRRRRSQ